MLIPRTHGRTRLQRDLIVGASIALIALCAGGVYIYERFYRGPTEDVFFGTWVIEGCYDCTSLITFQPNHDVIKFEDYWEQNHFQYRGHWYAGGRQLIIHRHDSSNSPLIVMQIQEITPQLIRVLWDGRETRLTRSPRTPPQASNQAMERTPTRSASVFRVAWTLPLRLALAFGGRRSSYSR
jgi:hypothetical protein